MAGIYIHIPFCASRCIYCGFFSTTGHSDLQDIYIDAVLREALLRQDYLHGEAVRTAYIGGGTPSLLSQKNLLRLGEMVRRQGGADEFTMECNPDDITPTLCRDMKEMGVNRVSMGVQTFSDTRLAFLHRRHRSCQIAPAVRMLRDEGVVNISVDLMFGFPNETLSQWEADIDKALALDVEHISAYSLMYEEGTPLYNMRARGEIAEVEECDSVSMYDTLTNTLAAAGYEHYEISNFARPGFHSRHNSSYWNATPYLGLGAAAHSYDKASRQWNVADLHEYIKAIMHGKVPAVREVIDNRTAYNDMITTALRTRNGIDLNALTEKERDYLLRSAQRCLEAGTLTVEQGRVRLTHRGLYVSDDVMSELIWV